MVHKHAGEISKTSTGDEEARDVFSNLGNIGPLQPSHRAMSTQDDQSNYAHGKGDVSRANSSQGIQQHAE